VVDDNAAFRNSFRKLLVKVPAVGEILEAADGESATEQVKLSAPDLVFMDITMPHLDGIEATRRILEEHPNTKIVMLTVHANRAFLEKSMEAGALGYLVKRSIHEELAQAVEKIMNGETYVSKTMENNLEPKKYDRRKGGNQND